MLRKLFAAGMLMVLTCAPAYASFKINEIDSDSPNTPSTDYAEFIELKGNPNEAATGLKLVWFNGGSTGGNAVSYRVIDLTTCTANAQGYLLVGTLSIPGVQIAWPGNTLQNGEDGIALYDSTGGSYPNGTQPAATGLLDYIVYQTSAAGVDDPHASNWGLLNGGIDPPVYDENGNGTGSTDSLGRIPDGTGTFIPQTPTPGSANILVKSYSVTNPVNFGPYNQATATVATTRSVTLTNTGGTSLTVSTFGLDAGSSSVFTVLTPPNITIPGQLGTGQSTSITLQFVDASPTVNKTYGGSINLSTDADSTPTLVIPITASLTRATQTAAVGAVKINEVCFNPGTTDHNRDGNTAGQSDEYVELFNTTGSPILIEGWEQTCIDFDNTNNHNSYVFPVGATIPANGWLTLFTAGTPVGFTAGTVYTTGGPARIRNTGAYVGISDATKLVDGIAYLGAEDSPDVDAYKNTGANAVAAGSSLGRRPDGANTFRGFEITDSILTDRPSPDTTNAATAVGDWSLFQ